jgi:hypothetical protein
MGDGQIETIYWLLMNFPYNLLTSCTSIEQVNLPPSHIGNIYYINTGTVTFLTHILCVSYWIMGDGQIENIYWLLMSFPDNLLTSCTSIEQVKLPPSHIGKILYQHRDSDIPNAHIMCLLLNNGWQTDRIYVLTSYELSIQFSHKLHFYWVGQPTFQSHSKNILYQHGDSDNPNTHILCISWIMGDGRMEYIYWLLMNFPDNLLTSCTSIEQVNLPYSHIGKYIISTPG